MAIENEASAPPYHTAKQIPFELIQHSGIFFEEKLYTQALTLLLNILTSGTVSPGPLFIPSPPHLAVAATFLVHPSTTTRAKSTEEKEAAGTALRLLRLTNTLVGPITAKFDTAFTFTHFEASRHGGRRRRAEDEETPNDEISKNEIKPLNFELSQSSAVWSRAEDFWHAVGWAFNCSVLHPERWERWYLWLQFMCEVLEDDWNERKKQFEEQQNSETPGTKNYQRQRQQALEQSLIFRYIEGGSAGYGRNRRIMRAIFADGTSNSINEFREVFHKELKQLKRDQGNIKKREVGVNIDEEQYGDYLTKDEDDSEGEGPDTTTTNDNTTTERRSKRTRRGTKSADPAANTVVKDAPTTTFAHGGLSLLGGFSSLALRQRLLHLLSAISADIPESFVRLDEIYHLFIENIRHLPLPIYQAFVSPSALPYFSDAAQTTLCEFLLFRLRESGAPESDEEFLSQNKLEQCFLPYATSTASMVDNTKMSIAIESLLTLLAGSDMLRVTPELQNAVQEGILARADQAQVEVRRNQASRKAEDIEWCWLIESGERILFMINELLPHVQSQGGTG